MMLLMKLKTQQQQLMRSLVGLGNTKTPHK